MLVSGENEESVRMWAYTGTNDAWICSWADIYGTISVTPVTRNRREDLQYKDDDPL